MTDNIHLHRLRRAWETCDSVGCKVVLVNVADLKHALEQLDDVAAVIEKYEPTDLYGWHMKEHVEEALRQ